MTLKPVYILLAAALLALPGCFTGVESTPRISAADVKKENVTVTPEERFLTDIAPMPPAQWAPGKPFLVTDNKISYIFSASSTASRDSLEGSVIRFDSIGKVPSVLGEDMAQIEFTAPGGGTLLYRTDLPYDELMSKTRFEIPFTVDCDLVDQVGSRLAGHRYYVVTPLWYEASTGEAVQGLRHVPVVVRRVEPGTHLYPVRVVFAAESDPGREYSVFMTLGSGRTSTRNFERLFAFSNPREKYPRITDQVWDLIIHSRVKEGMSRDECRLALGSPQTIGQRPTTAGMVEYWQYADGVYLLFDDQGLSYFRR